MTALAIVALILAAPAEKACPASPAAFVEVLRAQASAPPPEVAAAAGRVASRPYFVTGLPSSSSWAGMDAFHLGARTYVAELVVEYLGRRYIWTTPDPIPEACFATRAVEEATHRPGLVFADGFESGDLAAWRVRP